MFLGSFKMDAGRILVLAILAALALVPAAWSLREAYAHLVQSAGDGGDSSAKWYGRMMAVLFLFGLFVEYSLLSRIAFARRAQARGCLPAVTYPHWEPVLGLDMFVEGLRAMKDTRFLELVQGRFNAVGHTFWNKTLGTWVIMTDEPENVKAILASNFDDFAIAGPRLYAVLPLVGPNSIFTTNGKEWHRSRNLIRPSFVRDQVADLECFDRHIGDLLNRIPRDGSTFDLQDLLTAMTMDSSTDFLLGYSTNTLTTPSPRAQEFVRAFERVQAIGARGALLGAVMLLLPNREMREGMETIRSFIRHYMERAMGEMREKRERSYVFFDELVKSGASPDYILDQVLSIIIAGRDTTAGALTACFYFLARHPEVVRKLRQEIASVGEENPSWEALKGMTYLTNVIKETLRLVPPIPINSRETTRETVLPRGGGKDGQAPLLVPKGTPCRFSLHSLQRRKDMFGADADEFRPERWDDLRTKWEYIPFHGGPRICLGQQFATTQMMLTVYRVLQKFQAIEARDSGRMLLKNSAAISLAEGCMLSMTPA